MQEDWKPFWFKMLPSQFLSDRDIDCMTPMELGAFMRLVCRQFIDGDIPDNKKTIARLSRLTEEELESCWDMIEKMFPVISNGKRANRYNKHLRDTAIRDHNLRSSVATKAVNKRWEKNNEQSEVIVIDWIKSDIDKLAFEHIWATWPHRKDKRYSKGDRIKAEKNFSIILSNNISSYQLLRCAESYVNHPNVMEGFVRQVATFFDPQDGIYLELLKTIPRLSEADETKYIQHRVDTHTTLMMIREQHSPSKKTLTSPFMPD